MKFYVTRAREWFARQTWEVRVLGGSALLSFAVVLTQTIMVGEGAKLAAAERASAALSEGVDTFIPRGFVLVPIEVVNYEALDSILGKFGVVDLLTPGNPDGKDAKLVARNVRVLRAPKNPSHFAVLIRESDTGRILQYGSTFHVLIKRPGDKGGTEFVQEGKTRKRKIVYGGSL
jgi:hypothetical protein